MRGRSCHKLVNTYLDQHFFDEYHAWLQPYSQRIKYIQKLLSDDLIDSGRHRKVYSINNDYVLKVPRASGFSHINEEEWECFRKRQKYGSRWNKKIDFARCYLIQITGVSLLVMERLRHIRTPEDYWGDRIPKSWPSWVREIDCAQCGRNKLGKLVAFDYSDNF
jgi:hypothetical protein